MDPIREAAKRFFDACESGHGWDRCKEYCHPDATFSCQADSLAEVGTLEQYTEFMRGLYGALTDGSYEIRSFAVDEERGHAVAYGILRGTHLGEEGPLPPTGKSVESDYVYVMEFDGGRIRHMTKIWNDGHAMKQLGWA